MDEVVITDYGIKAPGVLDKSSFLNVLKNGVCTQSLVKNDCLLNCPPIVAGNE